MILSWFDQQTVLYRRKIYYMEYTLQDKFSLIKRDIVKCTSKNPVAIIKEMMCKDYINIHGPEHHFLDGAAFATAMRNAGGKFSLEECLNELENRAAKMPGAMCAYWGICGSTSSVAAVLSIIHKTSPLSTDEYYKDNMEYTSAVLSQMSKIGGARCCKRNAFLSLSYGVKFVKDKYGIEMETDKIICAFASQNKQCLGNKCPFYIANKI